MPDWITKDTVRADVIDPPSFANYAQQEMGVPYPSGRQMAVLRKKLTEFQTRNPAMDYPMLTRLVDYGKARKKRPPHAYLIFEFFRFAWADGYFPELTPSERKDNNLELLITGALTTETRPEWRRRLLASSGEITRREVYDAWKTSA